MSQSIWALGKRARNFGNTGIVCTTSPNADGLISRIREKFWELSNSVFKSTRVAYKEQKFLRHRRRAESRPKISFIVAEKRCRLCSRCTTSSSVTQLS